jgi:signal transduction histidine kinase
MPPRIDAPQTFSPASPPRQNGAIRTSRALSDANTGRTSVAAPHMLTRLLDARPRSRVAHLAIAISAVGVAFGVTMLLRTWTPHAVFMLFLLAVMISAWYGQLLAGTIAALLSVVMVGTVVLQASLLDEIEFVVVATLVAMTTSALAATQRRLDDIRRSDLARELARRTEAELSSKAKTDFLALLGHELRQPLGVILTAAELLARAPDPRTRERAKETLDHQAGLMTRLVEDLLDLSRVQRGVLELRAETVDGAQLFDEIAHTARPVVTRHGHRFTVSIPPAPVIMRVDAARMRQILSNLLTNAAKYTAAGGHIMLTIEAHGDTLRLRVRDTGRGIPPEFLPTMFDLYQRSRPEGGGMGVGLAVVKALTEAHGGTVEARSEGIGRGAEFIVTLPGAVDTRAQITGSSDGVVGACRAAI